MRLEKKQETVDPLINERDIPNNSLSNLSKVDSLLQKSSEADSTGKDADNNIVTNTNTISANNSSNENLKAALQNVTESGTNQTYGKSNKNAFSQIFAKIAPFFLKVKELITYTGEKTLPFRSQIRFKLVVAFIIPVVFILILGLFSYNNTKNTIVDNSKKSAKVSMESTSMYVNLMMDDNKTGTPDLSLDKMNDVLKATLVSDGSIIALVTVDGRETVISGNKSTIQEQMKGGKIFTGQNFYNKEIGKKELSGSSDITLFKQKYLFAYSKIGKTDAVLCTLIPESDVLGKLKNTRTVTIIMVLILGLLALLIGLIFASDIGKVIRKFSNTLKLVSAGDFTVRINTKRKDEFGLLSQDMDDMLVQIKTLVTDMANFGHNVSDAAVKVLGVSEEILTSINDVSDTVNVMNQGVSEQAKDTKKSFLQMTDFAGQIGETFNNTAKVGQVANITQQTINAGKNIIDELMQQVTATSEVTCVIIRDIDELQQQSESIGSVVETINNIASTTNLLSLNASIEAARAGEAGRGFAIVADQIRGLAEQSVDSVKRIEKIIKSIQKKTQITVTSAQNAEQMLESQTEALNNTVKVFKDVDNHMVELLNKMNQITDNMQTITLGKEEVLDVIKNMAAVTQQTLASSEVVGTNINTQITAVETLNVQAEEMKEKAKELENAINKFTI